MVFRSHGLVQQFPFVYKLVPAVALLVFSLWGLVPLVRQGRNLLLNVGFTIFSFLCIFLYNAFLPVLPQLKLMVPIVYDVLKLYGSIIVEE